MKRFLILLISTIALPNPVKAEITDKNILSNTFNSCVEQPSYEYGIGAQYIYCGCFVNKISKGMTNKEFLKFSLSMASEEQGSAAQNKIMYANKKIKSYILDCYQEMLDE